MASDIYPAVRRFLLESELIRTLKAFDKETAAGDAETTGLPKKKAKAIAKIELTAACQLALDASTTSPTNGVASVGEEVPKSKKRKHSAEEAEQAAAEEPEAEADEPPRKKKKKQVEAEAEAPEPATELATNEVSEKKKKKDKPKPEKTSGVPFSRVDDAKWRAMIKDDRLLDNTHKAKNKFGGSAGDSWGDSAAADMLKVKGKGFRKEMAKKKRASWRGGGELDQGVNSIRLADSSDDE